MCVLFESCWCCHRGWICFGVRAVLAPGGKFLEGVSFSWFGPSYKLHVGVLEMLHRSRGRSSKFTLDEWGVIGGDCKISVFNYYLCFVVFWSILQFLCYVFSICLPLGVGLCKGFFLAWKRGRGQVFNTHCVQVFYAYRFLYFLVLLYFGGILEVGEDRFPAGRVPDSDWRVNKWLETEQVFDCDEVAAEMHISLVRYKQEKKIHMASKLWIL